MKGRWFRFYEGTVDDPKVQRLPDALFRAWVNLLCIASKHDGRLPELADIAFTLRMTEKKAGEVIRKLMQAELIDSVGDDLSPHNWSDRQYKSDSSAERMRAKRERDKGRHSDADVTSQVTGGDSKSDALDTEVDTEKKENPPLTSFAPPPKSGEPCLPLTASADAPADKPPKPPPDKRGSRLSPDWQPSFNDVEFALGEGMKDEEIQREADRFRDYWHGKSGKDGCKLDWAATWRNWIRTARDRRSQAAPGGGPTGNRPSSPGVVATVHSLLSAKGGG